MIVLPMGGTMPGAIPYAASSRWFHDHGVEPESPDWQLCRNAWRAMDVARSEYDSKARDAAAKKAETK